MSQPLNVESAVRARYSAAAQNKVDALCCPIDYDRQYLKVIPQEILDRDYGCGDPSKHLHPGETVLDLGSGGGKICFIASQVVGPTGRVIGIDMNDDMLALARKHQRAVGDAIGWHNIEFRKGRIQDLALDLERLDAELKAHPLSSLNPVGRGSSRAVIETEVSARQEPRPTRSIESAAATGSDAYLALETLADELRVRYPLVATDSIDAVISNCVLNLVDPRAKAQLFSEIFRVLKKGGRAVISDIVSDEPVPDEMQSDPELWSGCIAGALTEEGFLRAFAEAGFYGIRILKLDPTPWRTVHGIEFRSMTVEASKGKQGACFDRGHAVIYKGPFQEVLDDDGNRMERGLRYAVCDKTWQLLQKSPYREHFEFIPPREEVPLESAPPFDRASKPLRHPKETKGEDYTATSAGSQCCDGGSCC